MDDASVRSPDSALELVTVVDHENYRCSWQAIMMPKWLLSAERWQVLSVVEGEGAHEVTRYDTEEVFGGILAYVVKFLKRDGLMQGFQAMADALKERAEET